MTTFVREFIYGLCPYLRMFLFVLVGATVVVEFHKYREYVSDEYSDIEYAIKRYARNCKDPNITYEQNFGTDCNQWGKQAEHNPYSEALNRLAQRWRLYDPDRGASPFLSVLFGVMIGVFFVTWLLNKAPQAYRQMLDEMNNEEDLRFMQNNRTGGASSTFFDYKNWPPDFLLSGKEKNS